MSGFISLEDESDEEGKLVVSWQSRVKWRWFVYGCRWGATSIGWGRGTGIIAWGTPLCLILAWSSCSSFASFYIPASKSNLYDKFHFFQDLDLLKRASWLREEAQQLETKQFGKIIVAVAGSEAEGLYRLLRGAISHSPISSAPSPPKDLTIPHLPLSPNHPLRSQKKWYLMLRFLW